MGYKVIDGKGVIPVVLLPSIEIITYSYDFSKLFLKELAKWHYY